MLEKFFENPTTVERLRGDPLGPHLESFAASLADLGYAASTGRSHLGFLGDFGEWLAREDLEVRDVDEQVVDAYLETRGPRGCVRRGQASSIRAFLEHLRDEERAPSCGLEPDETPLGLLESRYRRHLIAERGLCTATVINYLPFVRRFLGERFGNGQLDLRELAPHDISRFVVRHARSMSQGRARVMVTALRSFLRFLLTRGEIEVDLAASVPTVASWRLSTVPKYLTPSEVQRRYVPGT